MNSGSVDDPGPLTKVVITKSSKLNVNDSRNPATIAGSSCGQVIWRKVRHGVANRSALASTSVRSIPDRRARTSSRTRLVLNRTWAAMIVSRPNWSLTPNHELIASKLVANRISVARAMTISGTMMLM